VKRVLNLLLVVPFLAAIATPLAGNLYGLDGADAEAENRTLAPFPALEPTWASIAAYGPTLDAWFADHFGFRSWLVRWYSESRYFGLRVSPVATALRGKDDWLFYAEDGGLDDFANANPLSPEIVDIWRNEVIRERDFLRAHGIAYLFVLAPDKVQIYPEHFPDTVRQVSPVSRSDQLLTATYDTGVVLDVRQAMMAARDKERLYHKTDTHWNQRGAFIAYQEMIKAIRERVPAVPPPLTRDDFESTSRILLGQDLAGMMGLKRSMQEEDLRLTPKRPRRYVVIEPNGAYATAGEPRIVTEIPGSTLPRAVMFRDSYTSWLAPFLSEHFSRIVYLWQNDFDAAAILREKPDVVIHEMVGRHLYMYIPSPELIPDVKN